MIPQPSDSFSLADAGYEVIDAVDGQDALRKHETENINLMIIDLNMPKMDGIELIHHLRHDGVHRFLPFIMLTTESQEEKKKQGKAAGASGWIVKPFTPSQLMAIVKLICPV